MEVESSREGNNLPSKNQFCSIQSNFCYKDNRFSQLVEANPTLLLA